MDASQTVMEFVNSRSDAKGVEQFGSAADFKAWAQELGLMADETVSESEAGAARELRQALVTMLLAHSHHPDVTAERLDQSERYLEHAAELYPVRIAISADSSTVSGQARGAGGVMADVLAAANQLVQSGEWSRMKACCSYPCEHGFVDRTRNGAQRFCDSRCASRAGMRAMRERSRGA